MKILIKDIDIITCDDSCAEPTGFIKGGSIGIRDNIIEFVETSQTEAVQSFKADKVIDGKGRIAMPGLVNSHTHSAMTVLRNFADDLCLEDWLFNKVFPTESRMTPEDIYWGTMLGVAEMIRSGTTAFADMYLHMDYVAQAVSESGIRACLSKSPLRFNVGEKAETIDDAAGCFDYYRKWHNSSNGRIKVYVEVHSAYLFNEEKLTAAAGIAKQLNTGIHIHILETLHEREESIKKYGMNSAEICEKCGIFDVPVIAAHCVHLSDEDVELLKRKNVNVAHNPTSNLKLGSGIARIPYMLERGVNVCLGTDGTASNNNLNMFEEMHLAALIHKGANRNPVLVNAGQTIKMATSNGAKAIGFEGETGCIKKGMKADLIIINTDKPHFNPVNNHLSAVVYSAQASDVETVIIDGNMVMEGRELKTIDEEKIKFEVNAIAKRIIY